MYQETFNQTYRYSKPKAIRDLHDLIGTAEGGVQITGVHHRTMRGHELADMGYLLDVVIDIVYGGDAETTMLIRKNQGFTWVPSANQEPVRVMPGLTFPGLPSYDPDNPPVGSLKVSLDPKDFPISADLIVTSKPFSWAMHAFGRDGKAEYLGVGSTYTPIELSDVGAKWTERVSDTESRQYRKVSTPGQGGHPFILWERTK